MTKWRLNPDRSANPFMAVYILQFLHVRSVTKQYWFKKPITQTVEVWCNVPDQSRVYNNRIIAADQCLGTPTTWALRFGYIQPDTMAFAVFAKRFPTIEEYLAAAYKERQDWLDSNEAELRKELPVYLA